eukprot:gene7708-7771_t
MSVKAFICGCAGLAFNADERAFISHEKPWGLILFKSNIDHPDQVLALTSEFRALSGDANAPILIDQEGGRVQRMGPPHWPAYPPAAAFEAMEHLEPYERRELVRLSAQLMAADLRAVGINVDCLPVLDVPVAGSSNVIGNRAYAASPERVAMLGRAAAEGLMAGSVLPVMKHIPGHGRAFADSHLELPVVTTEQADLQAVDFYPFGVNADLPAAMTAHVVYTALDKEHPATVSPRIIQSFIRDTIGFSGLLMSDDLSMKALSGTFQHKAQAALAAGCDLVLHCNGELSEMQAVAEAVPALTEAASHRAARAMSVTRHMPEPIDLRQTVVMTQSSAKNNVPSFQFERSQTMAPVATDVDMLRIDIEGYEGPLDLLLDLARRQKVDLVRISVLALADQYLAFIEAARQIRLELAADYLVMAAWLAYLKSRLLLPSPAPDAEPDAAGLALHLAHRLRRLEAMRRAAERLVNRPSLGREFFARGMPEATTQSQAPLYQASLYDLLSAYAFQRQKHALSKVTLKQRFVWSLAEARAALVRILGVSQDWTALEPYLLTYAATPGQRRSIKASSFSASLELVREGFSLCAALAAAAPRCAKPIMKIQPFSLFEDPEHEKDVAALRVVEAMLFASAEALSESELGARLQGRSDIRDLLQILSRQYAGRGVELVRISDKWAFRTAKDLAWLLVEGAQEPKKLGRAAMETLAIIAYHQPTTRAEIEDIRGVAVARGTIDALLEAGWIRLRGRRRTPGRPVTYGTTARFLDHFGLEQISDLPGLDELKGAGLLDASLPRGLSIPVPRDDDALGDDEEPLEGTLVCLARA